MDDATHTVMPPDESPRRVRRFRLLSGGLGEGGILTVLGSLKLSWWNVAAGFLEPPVVEPVNVFEGGDFDLLGVRQGPLGLISSVLNRPNTDSARALS